MSDETTSAQDDSEMSPPLECSICGRLLIADVDVDLISHAGLPICANCNAELNYETIEIE